MEKSPTEQVTAVEKIEAFNRFLLELSLRARKTGVSLNLQIMIGRKRDFIAAARKYDPALARASEASFEEYMKTAGCKFPSGSASRTDFRIKNLFNV